MNMITQNQSLIPIRFEPEPLPPLPIKDGALYIDNSFLESFTTCPRLAEYSRLWRRVHGGVKPGRDFGSLAHLILETRYKLSGSDQPDYDTVVAQREVAQKFFSEHEFPEDDHRNLDWAIELLIDKYNERYGPEPFHILEDQNGKSMIEVPFAVELFVHKSIPIIYCGKVDLPTMEDNLVTIYDHKTSGRGGEMFFDGQRMSAQQHGYCWGFYKATGIMPQRFVINNIITAAKPIKPKAGWEAWWSERYMRYPEYITDVVLAEWEYNTIQKIKQFLWQYEQGYLPQFKTGCVKFGRCEYYEVCYSHSLKDRRELLESSMFIDNNWSPLKEEE